LRRSRGCYFQIGSLLTSSKNPTANLKIAKQNTVNALKSTLYVVSAPWGMGIVALELISPASVPEPLSLVSSTEATARSRNPPQPLIVGTYQINQQTTAS